MIRHCIAFCLILTLASAAWSNEITGIDSPAVDISRPPWFYANQYAVAFVPRPRNPQWHQHLVRPGKIVVQVRNANAGPGWVVCAADIAPPSNVTRLSHPALSISGWLFVTGHTPSGGWRLYATQRQPTLMDMARGYCGGWRADWIDLGNASRPITSAPDAVVVGAYTYVFVTAEDGFIDYRVFHRGQWLGWGTVQPIANAAAQRAESKPAVAAYTTGDTTTTLHLFWQNGFQIFHQALLPMGDLAPAVVWPTGRLTGRPFGNPVLRPNPVRNPSAACTAGPEVTAPTPLFLVCGAGGAYHYIAHYKNPELTWDDQESTETIAGDTWIRRSAGPGAVEPGMPSLGHTGISSFPLMFVTYAADYCPQPPPGPPPGSRRITRCWLDEAPGPWVIQRRWGSQMARFHRNALSGWQGAEPLPLPPTASKLYEWARP